jgi:methylmalonyl-CoA mutase
LGETPILLADSFPPAPREAWLGLVFKTLKGADLDSLMSHTADGLTLRPLYTGADAAAPAIFPQVARDVERPWDIRAQITHPDPGGANTQAQEELRGGASSILVRIDPTGRAGAAVGSAGDLARLLEAVDLDLAPVALDAGFMGLACADWLSEASKASPSAPLAFHLDPLSAWAGLGVSPGPIEAHLIAAANVAGRLTQVHPRASLFLASGRVIHEAGGTQAQELAFAIAAALAYAKAAVRAGASMETAFAGIVLGLCVDTDPFLGIAKLRAARVIWARVTQACGVDIPARIEARSSGRMLTRADPWTNLVRLTAAGFTGAVGGADAVVLGGFTDALGRPCPLARRMARNTQLVLMEEAHLGAVIDPLGGAGLVESLTHDLAEAAWRGFVAIEAAGGIVTALREGLVSAPVLAALDTLRADITAKSLRILGVTDFINADDKPVEIDASQPIGARAPDPRLPGPDSHCQALTPIQLEALAHG